MHSPEVKAEVLAALMAGQRVMEVAEQYKIPNQTVSMWREELDSGEIRAKRLEAFGNLLGDYLQETLKNPCCSSYPF